MAFGRRHELMEREDGRERPETIASESVYESTDFAVVRDTVRADSGDTYTVEYVSEPPAVVVYPFTTDGEVVVVDEWRQPVGRVNRGLPAGSVEDTEDIETAAKRELREETGFEASEVEHVRSVEPTNGLSDSVHHHVEAFGCTPTATQDLDSDERIVPTTVPEAALREALNSGDMRDGRTALAVAARTFRNP